jgi:hypothetical protein
MTIDLQNLFIDNTEKSFFVSCKRKNGGND